MRVLLAVGSAPCLFEDVEAARVLYPDAELMLINGAMTAFENAEHCLSGHTNKAEQFAAARRERFPSAPPWRLHANWRSENERSEAPLKYPSVTDWHGPEMSTGATSAGKAARIGIAALGFDRVVLCGCPMNFSGYFVGEAQVKHDCQRVGAPTDPKAKAIRYYREHLAVLAEREPFKSQLFSMSGYSRDVLGAP